MNTKSRLKEFLKNQGISGRTFSEKIGASENYFNNSKTLGSEYLEKIHEVYPVLNMDWVITGRGEMLVAADGQLNWDNVFDAEKTGVWQSKVTLLENELALKNELLELYRAQTGGGKQKSKTA
ncbi:MAG: helix-turn-helix transcriptional regulator [Bacteroidota bacterium]